ncbi:potassium channel subfamily T member 2 isoform X9 [Spodoptera frugiperda]|uniref:Potassium channel subfamily T member 2 isoform X9 n=1 Tax=Spodoptera frugiperda TaxID=7108 RepID=A0A9R0EF54_SPOFR|nr:potassium channel subfamily T member 2 isoform X9 [Spodoptera frugiperda]XP_035429668.1 potassium channel subfamily T member 2 isoform X9 [Spodoptera frugiperda]
MAAVSRYSSYNCLTGWDSYDKIPRVRVEYYVNENTFKERLQLYFIKNQRSSLRIRIANLFFKLLTCVLYICRVCADGDPITASCYGCRPGNKTEFEYSANLTEEEFQEHPIINWDGIIWVNRPLYLWVVQVILAMISFTEAILLAYLGYKGNIWQQVLSFHFILEMVNTIPFALTLPFPPLRNLFIPVFLNCWLAKRSLENMFNDLHRAMQKSQSALSQQLMILCVTLLCLVFTSVCGIQHFQRAGHRHLNLFQATYFVVVTFSTVGYGDFVPDIWPSQLFMVIMIGVALVVLPTQFEQLAFTWMERQKLGGSYSSHRAQSEKHVVVCSTTLHADTIMDFLNEFYAHPLLQDYYVVLLSPMELDTTMRMILQVPIWAQRVIYIQGSCLKDTDLIRARMNEAEACFILAARNYADKTAADEHTILRSWAVKDFAPAVPQYVQIFRPENKLHVKFAEFVVCEDEFKYALLANNCTCPGASTLVTLLLHTSRGQEGQQSPEEWHRLYGKCSGNEIYHIVLGDSRFFGEYEGKSFTYASFHSHRKYGVALVGVRPAELPEFYEETILLNPGPRHIMKNSDTCYYMSITKEENSAFVVADKQSEQKPTIPKDQTACSLLSNEKKPGDAEEVSDQQKKPDGSSVAQYDLPQVILQAPASSTPKASPSRINQANTVSSANFTVTGSKYGEGTSAGDSRTCSKDSPGTDSATDSHLLLPKPDNNFLSPDALNYRRGSRRPSILPVPDMVTSNLNIASDNQDEEVEADESEDELEDDVPWRSPSEKIADDVTTSSFSSLAASDIAHSAWRNDYMRIVKGFPPVSPFIGVSPTLCYLLKEKKSLCCLQLAQVCEHCAYRNAKEYQWQNKTIILAADYASNGIYNFIIPLRAHFRSKTSLNPIILLLERRPDIAFLDAISYFPLVYWMLGSIDCLDDLLRAGITLAENVVVVNKELSNSAEEDSLADCNTIVAVQTMFKFFPSIKSITELSQSSNMRFMQFRAHDKYALHLSKMEKREKERGSHISYMFRLPFAAGSVFSASMLDTLLYQAFVKDYVITFVRLLLGVDQAPGSGFLTSMKISKEDMWIRTYGRLYQKLCSTTCEIPIGIYRTQDTTLADASHHVSMSPRTPSKWFWSRLARMRPSRASLQQEEGEGGGFSTCGRREAASCLSGCYGERTPAYSTSLADEARDNHAQQIERAEIANLVRSRMESLNLTGIDYDDVSEKRNSLSYVIINPSCDLNLQEGDIIYLVRPSPFSAQKTFERHNSRRKSNISFCSQALIQAQGVSSRRGSTIGASFVPPRAPPLSTTKANSLSLPDSPTIITDFRGRSNSLRVVDDILLRRSNSLRQGLSGVGSRRRKSSLEEIGISHFNSLLQHQQQQQQQNAFKIALNGSIGLEVTPPEEHPLERLPGPSIPLGGYQEVAAALPSSSLGPSLPSVTPTPDPQHLQGTIV